MAVGRAAEDLTQKPRASPQGNQVWLDLIKAVAMLGVFLNHIAESIFGFPEIANPRVDWPSLAARFEQLLPLKGNGIWDIPVNLFRWTGWFGEHGFLKQSGPDRFRNEHLQLVRLI